MPKTVSLQELKELYYKDFPLWVEVNLELLKEKAYEAVDWENLLEEIQDMARSELKSAISHLAVILEHLYKWDHLRELTYGKDKGGYKWLDSIRNSRKELNKLFKLSPSLKKRLPEELQLAWELAKEESAYWLEKKERQELVQKIPEKCPYTYEEALTRDLKKELS